MANLKRKVHIYDPTFETHYHTWDKRHMWPCITSYSTTIAALKAELIRREVVIARQFSLAVAWGGEWWDEFERMQLPDEDVIYVQVITPHHPQLRIARLGSPPDTFDSWDALAFSIFSHVSGAPHSAPNALPASRNPESMKAKKHV